MNKLYVRVDAAKSWRSIILVISFIFSIAIVAPFAQGKSLFDERFYWAVGLFLFGIAYSILDRKYYYLALEERNLKIYRLFRSTIVIPISELVKLSYENRSITHVLVITYLQNGAEQSKEYEIRSHSTNLLIELNEVLRRINPKLEVIIDTNSQEYLDMNKNLYLNNPTAIIGWVWFCVKWFLIGLILCSAFIYWIIPKS